MYATTTEKIRYVQAYIHHMKRKHVQILPPVTHKQAQILEHCYQHAKKILNG